MKNIEEFLEKIKKVDQEKNAYAKLLCGLSGISAFLYGFISIRSYVLNQELNGQNNNLDPFSAIGKALGGVSEISGWFTLLMTVTIIGIVLYGVKIWSDRLVYKGLKGILTSIMLLIGVIVTWSVLSITWKVEHIFSDFKKGGSLLGLGVSASEVSGYANQSTFNFIVFLVVIGFLVSLCLFVLLLLSLKGKEVGMKEIKESVASVKKIPGNVKKVIIGILAFFVLVGTGVFAYNTFVKTSVDVLEGVTVVVDEETVSGQGTASVDTTQVKMTDNQAINEFKKATSYTLSKQSNLSNNETITLTANVNSGMMEKNRIQVPKLTKEVSIKDFRTIPADIAKIDLSIYTKQFESDLKKGVCTFSCDYYTNIKVTKQSEKYVNMQEVKSKKSYRGVEYGTNYYIYLVEYDYNTPKGFFTEAKSEHKTDYFIEYITGITLDKSGKLYTKNNAIRVSTNSSYSSTKTLDEAKQDIKETYDVEM